MEITIPYAVYNFRHLKAILGSGKTLEIKSNRPTVEFEMFLKNFIKENKLRRVRWWEIWKSTDYLYLIGEDFLDNKHEYVFAVTTI